MHSGEKYNSDCSASVAPGGQAIKSSGFTALLRDPLELLERLTGRRKGSGNRAQ